MQIFFISLLLIFSVYGREPLPLPTPEQVKWLEMEIQGFIHFGVNTYTGREWGWGTEDPNMFQPTKLNTTQWVETFQFVGANEVILVSKHHDGFFLYPNQFTNHTVEYSSWRGGKGDVIADFVKSCRKLGALPAFYLSPWDMNFYNLTWKPEYNAFYEKTLEVLLTRYGPVHEIWWDGANAQENMSLLYDWNDWYAEVKKFQPHCQATCTGPDAVWAGTESGLGKEENWGITHRNEQFPSKEWVYSPALLDVSIRGGWFYHPYEHPRYLADLINIYYKSVGRGYALQLNIPPNQDGLFADEDVQRMREFGDYIRKTFKTDLALSATTFAASNTREGHFVENVVNSDKMLYWMPSGDETNTGFIQIGFDTPVTFNVIMMQEYIRGGQTIAKYTIELFLDGQWKEVQTGTTIGHKKLHLYESNYTTTGLRLNILNTWNNYPPKVSRIGLFYSAPI